MKLAILGSNSEIAKDLIISFSNYTDYECTLYVRNPDKMKEWMRKENICKGYDVANYSSFNITSHYDVIINFVGVGNPEKSKTMGSLILDVTYEYDTLALEYLKSHSNTKYIFLSSGAVYGGDFEKPASDKTHAVIDVNHLKTTDWYTIAKLYAEVRHRAFSNALIIDIRIFNYYSYTQSLNSRFLITDIVRSIKNNTALKTSADNIVRDFITPEDFFRLIQVVINYKAVNMVVDAYTKSPVEKKVLLSEMKKNFGLIYEVSQCNHIMNATGKKINYYSLNKVAYKLGYLPVKTSLEGVLEEVDKFLIKT